MEAVPVPGLLIVDDQKEVRDALKSILQKMDVGSPAIFQAADCRSAIEMIHEHQPDIVFLDIMLHGKDGFSVARYVHENKISCHIIIMTAFPEFDFAMEALHYKVSEFIVKPITQENVFNAIYAVNRSRDQRKKEILNLNRQEMFYYLLLDHYLNNEEIRVSSEAVFEHTGMDRLRPAETLIIVASISASDSPHASAVSNVLADKGYEVVCYPQSESRFVFIVGCGHLPGPADTRSILHILDSRFESFLAGQSCYGGGLSFKTKYQQAMTALDYARENNLVNNIVSLEDSEAVRWIFEKQEKSLKKALSEGNEMVIRRSVEAVFVEAMKKNLSGTEVACRFREFIGQMGLDASQVSSQDDYFSVKSSIIKTLTETRSVDPEDALPSKIREVIIYVEDHYMDDISLSDIADELKVNYYYLSNLFKKNMDIGFTEYLNCFRLERAARLLITTRYPVNHVARVSGYENPRYFYKRFKDHFSRTPRQYREDHRMRGNGQ